MKRIVFRKDCVLTRVTYEHINWLTFLPILPRKEVFSVLANSFLLVDEVWLSEKKRPCRTLTGVLRRDDTRWEYLDILESDVDIYEE